MIQPRIQSRAVELDPFVIVVAAIFGGTLLGIIGALLAIPVAAALQIAVREFMLYRRGGVDAVEDEDRRWNQPSAQTTPVPHRAGRHR